MNDIIKNKQLDPDLLKRTVLGYFAVLIIFAAIATLMWTSPIKFYWIVLPYLIAGIILNRFVLRHFKWHPIYNTLQNVASAKMAYVIAWPLLYLQLIFKLLVVKYL